MTPDRHHRSPTRLKANDPCWCGSGKKFKRCHKAVLRPDPARDGQPADAPVPDEHRAPALRRSTGGAEPSASEPDVKDGRRRSSGCAAPGAAAAEILRVRSAPPSRPASPPTSSTALCHEACHRRRRLPEPAQLRRPIPKSVCTSVNEVICHGIPDDRPCATATSSTSTSPCSARACTATPTPRSSSARSTPSPRAWSRITRECLAAGIDAVTPGPADLRHRPGHPGRTPRAPASAWCKAFIGHGVGDEFHTDLDDPPLLRPAGRRRSWSRG